MVHLLGVDKKHVNVNLELFTELYQDSGLPLEIFLFSVFSSLKAMELLSN